jgi:uncharacterized membrane protein
MSGAFKPAKRSRIASMSAVHWRLAVSVAVGLTAFLAAQMLGAPLPTHLLIGWNAGAVCYLLLLWVLFLTADTAKVHRLCEREDESRAMLLVIVLSLVLASLVAIVQAMIIVRNEPDWQRAMVAGLAGLTLFSSWTLLQSVFVVHYAHRHFESPPGKGFGFSGDPPKDYMDFVYLSFCIGATFQVSDMTVNTTRLRNLITAHAATAYLFNTAILALGINIMAGLVGHG